MLESVAAADVQGLDVVSLIRLIKLVIPRYLFLCLGLLLFFRLFFLLLCLTSGFNLPDGQRLDPLHSDESPETISRGTNESESLKCHRLLVILPACVEELVCWYPLSEGACPLPHVSVVLSTCFDAGCVVIEAVGEGTTGALEGEMGSLSWIVVETGLSHNPGDIHLKTKNLRETPGDIIPVDPALRTVMCLL